MSNTTSSAFSIKRSASGQCAAHQSPKNGLADRSLSTMRVSGRVTKSLPTEEDILEACIDRLQAWTEHQIQTGVRKVRDALAAGKSLDETLCDQIDGPAERRDKWSALCALIVIYARAERHQALFWQASSVVLNSARMSKQAASSRQWSCVSERIVEFQDRRPNATAQEYVDFLCAYADRMGFAKEHSAFLDDVVIEREDGSLMAIQKDSVRRSFQRIRGRKLHASGK